MQDAELYRRSNQLQFLEAKNFLDWCHRQGMLSFKDNERIIDVGCGPGDVTISVLKPILPEDVTLVGVDLSKDMVDYAINNFSSDNVRFEKVDIEDKNMVREMIGRSRFDKIFSFHCLQWINNHRLAFQNLREMLVAGGSMYLIFIASSKMNELNDKLVQMPKWRQYLKILDEFSPKINIQGDLEEYFYTLLKELNFKVTECKLTKSQYTFGSLQHLSDLIIALHPAVKEMLSETMHSFMDDIKRVILDENLGDFDPVTGQITANHCILTIVASKPIV